MTASHGGTGPEPAPPQSNLASVDRAREMLRLRTVEGLTLHAIGKRFGVGPERVRQIINRYVYKTTGKPPAPGALSTNAANIRQATTSRKRKRTPPS